MIEMVSHMRKLASAIHALKSDVAENSTLTKATFDRQIEFESRQTAKLDEMAMQSAEMLAVFNAGKKGIGFFRRLGRMLFSLAKLLGRTLYSLARWAGPILAVGGALYALWHGAPTKGSE
jgi:hypothetical protein